MARTAVTINNLALGSHIADPTADAIDAANGMYVAAQNYRVLLRIKNTFAGAKTITVAAGNRPPAIVAAAAAQSYAQDEVKWYLLEPAGGARHSQADGKTNIDFAAGTTGEITAFLLPQGI